MKRILRRTLGSLALVAAGAVFAQAPKPLANPNFRLVDGGTVYASARHPDGGAVLIGNFTSINGEVHSGIARLRPDGSVDSSWGSVWYQHYPQGFNRPVVAVDGSGAAYAAGIVNSYPGLVKLSASTGEVVADWRSSVGSFPFFSLAADATGIYVGKLDGFFKVSTETGTTQWSAPYAATSLTLDRRGSIYAMVADHSDPPRQFIARFSADTGALDTGWNPAVVPINGWPQPLAVDVCGSVYVAGRLGVDGGQPRDGVMKISASDGQVDPHWNPGNVAGVSSITTDAECSVYLGGRFETIAGKPRRNLAKLSRLDGHVVDDWAPEGVCCGVNELAPDSQGRITVAGSFHRIGKQTRLGFAALDTVTGDAGSAIDAEAPPQVTTIAADPNGGVVVGGFFAKAGSLPRHGLLRLRANGTLDPDWAPALEGYVQVSALSARPGGTVYVGGSFERANLQTRRNIAKFVGATGDLDPAWNADADGLVEALAVGADDSVYVGGSFSAIGGRAQANIAKLSAETGLAYANWNPRPDGEISALAVDSAGAVYAGGTFREMGGQLHWNLAKIASDGVVLQNWAGEASSSPATLVATEAALYVASIGWPVEKRSIVSGVADPDWQPSTISGGGTRGFAAVRGDSVYAVMWYPMGERQLKRYSAETGAEDPAWNISPPTDLTGPLAIDTRGTVYVGSFTPSGLAAYSADTVFFDPFDP